MKKPTHGGYRWEKKPEERRVSVLLTLSPETIEALAPYKSGRGQIMDKAVAMYMQSPAARLPRYKPGDTVIITDPNDPDYHTQRTVLGLSPSTSKKRRAGQWRYRLDNDAYIEEDKLEPR